jgi:hypothetical protein
MGAFETGFTNVIGVRIMTSMEVVIVAIQIDVLKIEVAHTRNIASLGKHRLGSLGRFRIGEHSAKEYG